MKLQKKKQLYIKLHCPSQQH